jgi:hypothetical protein
VICIVCRPCHAVFRVTDAGQSELFVEIVAEGLCCPRCAGQVVSVKYKDIDDAVLNYFSIIDLLTEEFFRAQKGLGLPDERECDLETVQRLLTPSLVHVVGRDIPNTGRAVIDRLELEDGTVLHLGASAHGAVVYRITNTQHARPEVSDEDR